MTTTRTTTAEGTTRRIRRLQEENHRLRRLLGEAEALAEQKDRLARLEARNAELERRLVHLHRLAALGTMAAMVAHEFNNILTPVVNYAELAMRNPRMVGKALARAAGCGQRATDICAALLGLAGGEAPEPQDVNLSELVAETLLAMARDPDKDGIDLRASVPDDLSLTLRKVELQQVLLNLLLNARTAVLKRSGRRKIEISAERRSDGIALTVRDNGVGISPGDLERIFQPFYSTCTEADDHGGHGLGLAVCREIVTSLGGRIDVVSAPGQGATFTVLLPA